MTRRSPIYVTPAGEDLAMQAMELHAVLQEQVLTEILSSPAEGMRAANRAGVTEALFLHEDLKLIYLACRDTDSKMAALSNATRALIARGFWDYHDNFGGAQVWTCRRLVRFARRFSTFPPNKGFLHGCIMLDGKRLLHVHHHLMMASKHQVAAAAIMHEALLPPAKRKRRVAA
jgi:hypothetical protein